MKMSAQFGRAGVRRSERVASARTSLIEAAVLLHVAKEPVTTDPEFARWVEQQKFRHPQTGNDVQFKSLPTEEQAKIRARWQQAKQQEPQGEQKKKPEDDKGRGEKKEDSYYEQRRRREEQSFASWLAEQDDDLLKTWESGSPKSQSYVHGKFEKSLKQKPTYTGQKEKEAKEERWKAWLEEQGPEAQQAWSTGTQAEKLKVRREFAKKEKTESDARAEEHRKKWEADREKRRVPVDKFREMPKDERPPGWVESDNGNRLYGPSAEVSAEAKLEKTDVAGKVEGQSELKHSSVGQGSRVSDSQLQGCTIEEYSVVEDGASLTGVRVSDRARVRGGKISNAEIRGGTWDNIEFDGNNGVFHDSYDPETLKVLGGIKSRGSRGPGDGPLRAMIRYLSDGGRTKGWLGGKLDRKKLTRKIQQHIYDGYDRKEPWLGRGADFIADLDDEGFSHLMDVAQREADEIKAKRRKKKAMLYELTKTALERPELRPKLMPLVRLGRESRVAAEGADLRQAVIKAAYESDDPELKRALVRCVVAADRAPEKTPQEVPMSPEERAELVRRAYASKDASERREILTTIKEADARHDELIDALSIERDAWDHEGSITAQEQAQLVRVAYQTTDTARRREILTIIKEAKYSPGFMKWVEKQKFKHPQTGNDVQFVSLPTDEQKKIHEQWKAGKKDWAQQFKPDGLTEETELTAEKFDQLKPGDKLWISWAPYAAHEVLGFDKTKTGKPVLKMQITNPKTGETEVRYMHRSSAGNPKHEIHVLPKGAQPKDPKAEAKAPKEEPKAPEKAEEPKPKKPKKPKKQPKPKAKIPEAAAESLQAMNANAASWMDGPGMPGHGADFGDDDAPYEEGAVIEIEEGGYAPLKLQVKSPKLVVGPGGTAMMAEYMPGQSLQGTTLIPIGNKYEPKSMKKIEAPKAEAEVEEDEESWDQGEDLYEEHGVDMSPDQKHKKKKEEGAKLKVPKTPDDRHTESPKGAHDINSHEIAEGHTVYVGGTPATVTEAVPDPDKFGQLLTLDTGQKVNSLFLDGPKGSPSYAYVSGTPKAKKPKEEAKPKPEGDEHKPTGKHKDRKKLVGKGKAGDAKVRMTATVKESFVPEGLSEEAKKATEAGFKGLTYDGLRKLESNVAAAVADPEGAYAQALAGSGYTPGDLSKMHATIKDLLKGADGRKYNKTVLNVANKYDLEAEDADELREFKGDKPGYGRKLTPNELMQKFLAKAKPETKKRMQGMAIDDFMAMYNAIMAEEDEEEDLS